MFQKGTEKGEGKWDKMARIVLEISTIRNIRTDGHTCKQ